MNTPLTSLTFGLYPEVYALAALVAAASRDLIGVRGRAEERRAAAADIRMTAFYLGSEAGFLLRVREGELVAPFLHLLVLPDGFGSVLVYEWKAASPEAPPTKIHDDALKTGPQKFAERDPHEVRDHLFRRIAVHLRPAKGVR